MTEMNMKPPVDIVDAYLMWLATFKVLLYRAPRSSKCYKHCLGVKVLWDMMDNSR